ADTDEASFNARRDRLLLKIYGATPCTSVRSIVTALLPPGVQLRSGPLGESIEAGVSIWIEVDFPDTPRWYTTRRESFGMIVGMISVLPV
ncbi:hypothetical protein HK405_006806, partial [Cladochytrium tenue]